MRGTSKPPTNFKKGLTVDGERYRPSYIGVDVSWIFGSLKSLVLRDLSFAAMPVADHGSPVPRERPGHVGLASFSPDYYLALSTPGG